MINTSVKARHKRIIEEISRATLRILKEAVESVIATGNLTQDYSQRLNGFVGRLEMGIPDPHVLKEMIKEVILDTRNLEESNSELNQKFEKASTGGERAAQKAGAIRAGGHAGRAHRPLQPELPRQEPSKPSSGNTRKCQSPSASS